MEQDILSEINTAEDALRAAWSRGDAGTVADLRARLSRLWERRRAEQAARGQPRQPAPEPLRGVKGPRSRRAGR
jgi:hypothetical protein